MEIVTQADITRMRTRTRAGPTPNKRFTGPNGRTSVADTVVVFPTSPGGFPASVALLLTTCLH